MKLIKHINNNFAVAEDSAGNIIIVQGKGIGFGELPRELIDFKGLIRTYYNLNESYISMINDIPSEVISLSGKIIDKAINTIDCMLSDNIIFTLADHICFSIERYKKKMNIKMPILYDVKNLYEKEYAVGIYALKLIKEELHEYLPEEESIYIALHLINAEQMEKSRYVDNPTIISEITKLIEDEYHIVVMKDSFNYSRFVSHMNYLLKRCEKKQVIQTKNGLIFEKVRTTYPESFECANKVANFLEESIEVKLNDEEMLYIMLHINRLCSRETCSENNY